MNKVEKAEKLKLNKEQKEAIKHRDGPLLVIAGAGTGKTTVVVERIKYLILNKLAKPEEILALTFTEKAAAEMEERVDVVLPYGYTQMWISTFHSFGDRVLRDEAIQIGLNPDFALLSEAESLLFLRNNLFKLNLDYFRPLSNPNKFLYGLLNHFNRLRDEDITAEEYLKYAADLNKKTVTLKARLPARQAQKGTEDTEMTKEEKDKTMELARVYQKYEELKIKEGVMDFADLIVTTLRLFRERKNVLEEYQKKFKYILVDEFQDTNIAQNELVNLLALGHKNLTVVADDDQSIYKWRGAAVSNVIQFKITYPGAKLVVLNQNYRSTQEILDRAYKLIQNNNPDRLEVKEKISKKLLAVRKIKGKPIDFIWRNRVEDEAEEVAREIKRLTPTPYQYNEIAILVRANNHSEPFVMALTRQGIPYQFLGPGQLFRQGEVKDLIAYLKVLYNFEDNVAWYRVLNIDVFDLSARDIAAIINFTRKLNLSLFEACEAMTNSNETRNRGIEIPQISRKTKETLTGLVKMVHRHLKLVPKETAGQILYYFLVETGLLTKLAQYKTRTDERQAQNIAKFFDKLRSYEVDHEDASVQAVVDWIMLKMELGESPLASDVDWVQENRVNILTVHSAKGLEFPVVFLVNLVAQRFPTMARREQIPIPGELIKEILPEGDSHLEEERRLFYVGMTRARDRLYFSAADYYGEGKKEKKISPFVLEALGRVEKKKRDDESQLILFDWAEKKEEAEEITGKPIFYLSYSQIETFDRCPRQYKYKNILRIPVPKHFAASFGSVIHDTLSGFYRLGILGRTPTWKDLFLLYKKNWIAEGYHSKKHEKKYFEKGKAYLKKYFKSEFNPKIKTIATEKNFKIPISPNLKVGGRIDRIDEFGDGSIEIIDYKTGKTKEEKEIDKDLQMTLYAMAATSPTGLGKNPEEVNLSFYYFEGGKKITTKRTGIQLKEAREKILKKAKEIEESSFPPKPADPFPCGFCEYRLICEAWK
jgi:DNA helicase-2/ATP-dependent DNA helicase PcrA